MQHIADARPSARDWRIDFWRGAAVLMIFLNHVPNNPLSFLTSRTFGISDGAELFVFLSGATMATMLGRRYADRRRQVPRYAVRRAGIIYLHHLGLVLIVFAIATAHLALTGKADTLGSLFLTPLLEAPLAMTGRLLTLTYLPSLLDILPLYVLLTLLVGLAYPLLGVRPFAYLAVGIALWLIAALTAANLPAYPADRGWTFNPLAWQLIFFIGFAVVQAKERPWFRRAFFAWPLIAASVLVVIVGLVVAAPWSFRGMLGEWRPLSFVWAFADKQSLSLLRVVHFLACAHLVALLMPRGAGLRTTALARALTAIGERTLPLFVLSTALAAAAHAILFSAGGSAANTVLVSIVGVAIILGAAFAGRAVRRQREHTPTASLLRHGEGAPAADIVPVAAAADSWRSPGPYRTFK